MLRLPVMKTLVSTLVLLCCACAGPEEHRKPTADSALSVEAAAAPRKPAGSVLDAESPLDVGDAPAPAKPHQHHGSMPMAPPAEVPAPEVKPPAAKPHEHHVTEAPVPAAVDEKVEDPVCHMKINPAKAGGGSLTLDGQKNYFCSSSCRSKFVAAHPEAK
ncbi:MAG: hypothetical protein QM817_34795 [Archangium sp.]